MAPKAEKVEQQEAEKQEEEEEEEEEEFAAPEEMQEEEEEEEEEEDAEVEEEDEQQEGGEEDETAAEVSVPDTTINTASSPDAAQQTQAKDVAAASPSKQDQERAVGDQDKTSGEEALGQSRIQDGESQAASSTAGTAATSAAAPSVVGEMDLKNLEAQATKVAHDMQTAALEMSSKLTAGFKSALGGLGAAEPQSLSKLAGGLASWWSSLDPPAQPKRNEMAEQVQASSKATSELQELLGLLPEENLVESFKCKLLQTYACSHNSFTPAIQMAFQGTLYITDKHTCFTVEERNRKVPFKVLHAEIAKAERHRPQRKGDLSDVLRLELVPGTSGDASQQSLAFKDFDSGSALDSALALVEHLMDGS